MNFFLNHVSLFRPLCVTVYTVCQLHTQLSSSGIPQYNGSPTFLKASAVRKPMACHSNMILHTELWHASEKCF